MGIIIWQSPDGNAYTWAPDSAERQVPGLPDPLAGFTAYMDYVLTFFQDRLARGKTIST